MHLHSGTLLNMQVTVAIIIDVDDFLKMAPFNRETDSGLVPIRSNRSRPIGSPISQESL